MRKTFLLGAVCLFFVTGCGGAKNGATPAAQAPEAPATGVTQKTPDLANAGAVAGRVLYDGAAPAPKSIPVQGNPECSVLHPGGMIPSEELLVKNGGLANAFVYVKEGLEGYSFETPKEPVTITNSKCTYSPHVTGVQAGQPIVFLNSDSTLHNIHAYPKINKAFNLGLPIVNMKQTKTFASPEVMIPLKCDVHPWMQGYLGVLPHPYFAVTDAAGNFELKNLPPGDYTVEVWHEKLGVQSQKIRIEPRQNQSLNFTYSAKG